MTQHDEDHVELSKTEARQGVEVNSMRYVLGWGLAGAVVLLLALVVVYGT